MLTDDFRIWASGLLTSVDDCGTLSTSAFLGLPEFDSVEANDRFDCV